MDIQIRQRCTVLQQDRDPQNLIVPGNKEVCFVQVEQRAGRVHVGEKTLSLRQTRGPGEGDAVGAWLECFSTFGDLHHGQGVDATRPCTGF